MGWIHLRFPNYTVGDDDRILPTAFEPYSRGQWHVDDGHFYHHKLDSPEQSVTLLPMLRPVNALGGNTLIIKNSHKKVARYLARQGHVGVTYRRLYAYANYIAENADPLDIIEAATCTAGDILVMHPFVVHSSSKNTEGSPWRVSFNMTIMWKANPFSTGITCPLKTSITEALSDSVSVAIEASILHYGQPIQILFSSSQVPMKIERDDDDINMELRIICNEEDRNKRGFRGKSREVKLGDEINICYRPLKADESANPSTDVYKYYMSVVDNVVSLTEIKDSNCAFVVEMHTQEIIPELSILGDCKTLYYLRHKSSKNKIYMDPSTQIFSCDSRDVEEDWQSLKFILL
jgi:hypothetical protein